MIFLFEMQYVNYKKLAAVLGLGALVWFVPHSDAISAQAWQLFTIFLTTIIAIIVSPMPMEAIAVASIAVATITKTLTLSQALSGFSNSIVWLVVFAFFISRGFSKTNLGRRIAYFFISKLGHSTLGLGYGLIFTELILSPLIPSVTARGGGIIFPIAKSLVDEYSRETRTSSKRTGGYIMKVCFQSNIITSAMFLTAMAANPLVIQIAFDNGVVISWGTWAVAAILPGIVSLLLLPLILFKLHKPDITRSESAPKIAKKELEKIGALAWNEIILLLVFLFLITFWIIGYKFGISATTTALLGFTILLITGVLTMDDAVAEKGAWKTFTWFATLIMLSGFLSKFGLISWLGEQIDDVINMDRTISTMVFILVSFFFIHYFFASATTLISTLYATFLLVLFKVGIPPLVAALSLGFVGILSSGLTHFGIASAPIFFGAGYLSTKTWWYLGFWVGVANFIIWAFICTFWWKALGWW